MRCLWAKVIEERDLAKLLSLEADLLRCCRLCLLEAEIARVLVVPL